MSQSGHSHDNHDQGDHDCEEHAHGYEGRRPAHYSYGGHSHGHHHGDDGHGGQGHTLGVIDSTIATTDRGIWAIKWSFAGLMATALFQVVIVALSGSVALLADTIHNFGDASTAIPL